MNYKSKFVASAVMISFIGLSGGFVIAKSITVQKNNTASALIPIQEELNEKEKVYTDENLDNNTNKKLPVEVTKKIETPTEVATCPKPKKVYEDASFLDVGQDVPLTDTFYIPSNLVKLDKDISKYHICVKEEVAEALKSMIGAASLEGYTIIVSSGFRDYYTQKSIIERETKNGNPNVNVAVAKPGYSEHQLGVAVDLTSKSIAYASATMKFGDTPESDWLEKHASEYGFIESYPKGKEAITGYMYEPWHYRYVGIENATEIVKSGQTLNEYMKQKKVLSLNKNTP